METEENKKKESIVSKLEMFDALMENIPDSIYFKDLKSRFIEISKALAERLKINDIDEALGKTDFDFFSKEHAEKAFRDEQYIIKTNIPILKTVEKETYVDKEDRWVSTIKMPLYGKNRKLIGIFGISRDITEYKKTEHTIIGQVKELQAFYSLTEISEKEDITLDKLYQEVVNVLPKSWQYTEVAFARIVIGSNEFYTKNYMESAWKQTAPIKVFGSIIGIVEVGYLEERPIESEGPFLKDERLLINAIAQRLGRITERKKAETEILYLSYHDQLTGLYNRRFFEEELKRLNTKRQLPISIIMADVDGLKYLNDSGGHEMGDSLLIAISEIIKNSCRKEDIITRWGGDEFIISLPKTSEKDAQDVIERIRKATKDQKLKDRINISISLGLARIFYNFRNCN
ncbi:MAG: GGDEF domain-containing protein [Actinobacteria bacterium]|nr:GGDEF domain-containing protein [Actinomycetota bacterium]